MPTSRPREASQFLYDVFISYRTNIHPDRAVAEELQHVLETFPVPHEFRENIVAQGRWRQRLRVFRDTTDLNATPSLSEAIEEKLRMSRFLIVVCTPSTPKSPYCTEEIRYFRKYHGDLYVLPLLAKGEPSESFPTSLVSPESARSDDGPPEKEKQREPLAADVRAATEKAIVRRLKGGGIPKSLQVKFKLLGPILGCKTPDDLVRRDTQRARRTLALYCSVILAVLVGFASYVFDQNRRRQIRLSDREFTSALKEWGGTEPKSGLWTMYQASLLAKQAWDDQRVENSLRWISAKLETVGVSLHSASRPNTTIKFSRNGTEVFTVFDSVIRVWNADDGSLQRAVRLNDTAVTFIDCSPKDDRVVTAYEDGMICVWNGRTGEILKRLEGHSKVVNSAVFSPDAHSILSASDDSSIRLWDIGSGECQKQMRPETGVTNYTYARFISADSNRILSHDWRGRAAVWDITKAKRMYHIQSGTLSSDGNMIVGRGGGNNGTATLLKYADLNSAEELNYMGMYAFYKPAREHDLFVPELRYSFVNSAEFDVAGKSVVTTIGNKACIWDVATGRLKSRLEGHQDEVTCACFTPDSAFVLTASNDKSIRVWDAKTFECVRIIRGHSSPIRWLACSPRAPFRVIGVADDGSVRLWKVHEGIALTRFHGQSGLATAFSPDGSRVATVDGPSGNRVARIWDTLTGEKICILRGNADKLTGRAFSTEGKLAVATSYGKAWVFDSQSGEVQEELTAETDNIASAEFSPDGKRVATLLTTPTGPAKWKGAIAIWDTTTWKMGKPITGDLNMPTSLLFSPRGGYLRFIESQGPYSVHHVLNSSTGASVSLPDGEFITAFTPDEIRIATKSANKGIRIRDIETGSLVSELEQTRDEFAADHPNTIFSPDGQQIAVSPSFGGGEWLGIWDVNSGKLNGVLSAAGGHHDLIAFDNDLIVSRGNGILGKKSLCVFDPATDLLLCEFGLHDIEGNNRIALDDQFSQAIVPAYDASTRIWRLPKNLPNNLSTTKLLLEVTTCSTHDKTGKFRRLEYSEWESKKRELEERW